MSQEKLKDGPLTGIKVLDLSRVLAGPVATQILGDMGAEILKIERAPKGDDTRSWGPPFLKDDEGEDTSESAYYLSANRNKKSVAIDIAAPQGQAQIKELLKDCDVLIENFKVGGLKKYGLSYDDLKDEFPSLIYCSITGFGQGGPLAHEPGYDFMIQALSGLMSVTGSPDQEPTKTGVAVCDYVTGLYAVVGITSALRARDISGKGQHVDLALLDSTLAMMTNIAQYTLTSEKNPPRVGNAHTAIVPYQAFETAEGWMIIAVGNDDQFARLCHVLGQAYLAEDEDYKTNTARVKNRDILIPMIAKELKKQHMPYWLDAFDKNNIPHGPVQLMSEALNMEQVKSRGMIIEMNHPLTNRKIKLVGSPLKFSDTPVTYRYAPPIIEDTQKDT
jgi:crotonobetainyl-CoA:carnitine CoA-transferase CaiB-like acyl-CoA transferase